MDIKAFWNDVITQNRFTLPSYFCEDAVICWHCTNGIVIIRGNGMVKLKRIEQFDSKIIIVGKVQSFDNTISCHVTTFIKLLDDKICEMDEYWADDGEIPSWRKKLGIGTTIN